MEVKRRVTKVMSMQQRKVGKLASAVGVTVCALHHYDRTGLVCRSDRAAFGYRL